MKNLAGDRDCDRTIESELTQAGIEILKLPGSLNLEVPASIIGILGPFKFSRAWYYWEAEGKVPLAVANEMYETEIGRKFIRVAGHAGCPPPHEWAFPELDDSLASQLTALGLDCPTYDEIAELLDSGQITGDRFVNPYHIDSQEGLNLFAATLRKHDLV